MKKSIKITAFVIIALMVLVGLCSLFFPRYYDGFSRTDQSKLELNLIGMVVKKLTAEDKLTPEVWRKINGIEDLAPLVAPQIEGANDHLLDPWGNQYLLEKREENGRMVFTIHSSRQLQRRWYEWKNKVLGIEITVMQQEGKIVQIKDLWRDD